MFFLTGSGRNSCGSCAGGHFRAQDGQTGKTLGGLEASFCDLGNMCRFWQQCIRKMWKAPQYARKHQVACAYLFCWGANGFDWRYRERTYFGADDIFDTSIKTKETSCFPPGPGFQRSRPGGPRTCFPVLGHLDRSHGLDLQVGRPVHATHRLESLAGCLSPPRADKNTVGTHSIE